MAETIDEYIAQFPENIQTILQKIRETIHEAVPEAKEKISYGMPTFTLYGNLVHFSAHTNHIGFYPMPNGIDEFIAELEPYRTGKGTIQFPYSGPIRYDLITKVTLWRAEEDRKKAALKKKPKK